MRRCAIILSLIATILTVRVTDAHDAAPTGTPPAARPLLQLTLDELAPDHDVIVGVIRSTFLPGGELGLGAGTGPTIVFVESGTIVVASDESGSVPDVVCSGESGSPECHDDDLAAGDALIVPSNTQATIRNAGAAPATTLTLFSAEDARTTVERDVAQAILVRLVTMPPPTPLTLTLARATIEPAERFSLPPDPTVTVLAVVERSQAFSLSGDEINRGKEPIDIYVLTLDPLTAAGRSWRP
jgi:hypothetical protein